MTGNRNTLTVDEIRALPAVVPFNVACRVRGIGLTFAREKLAQGELDFPVLRLGRSLTVPTAPLLALLGIERDRPMEGRTSPRPMEGTRDGSSVER